MEYNEKVFDVLSNFMEYKEYKGDPDKAVNVILKKFPDVSKEQCSILFKSCCVAYADAVKMVKENHTHYAVPNNSEPLEAELKYRKYILLFLIKFNPG